MEKKQEEPKEFERICKKEFEVTGIEVETNKYNVSEVQRIRFKTSIGDITWRPLMVKEEYRGALKLKKTLPCEVDMLPQRINEFNTLLTDKGKFKIIGDYTKMKGEKDGEVIYYRFINSEKTLNEWKIQKEKEEKIDG